MKTAQLATLYFLCLLGLLPVAASAQPYTISADGNEVIDQKTGLIWKRCSEGMSWDGTSCAGTASTFTHEAALAQAASQASSSGVAWRLPNVKELTSIADKSLIGPAIDSTVFPATPTNAFWSSSRIVGDSNYVMAVSFYDGAVSSGFFRGDRGVCVRLVRAGQ